MKYRVTLTLPASIMYEVEAETADAAENLAYMELWTSPDIPRAWKEGVDAHTEEVA